MAINLAKKYEEQVAERFAKGSITESATNKEYKFNGVRSVTVYTIETAPLGDYERSGQQRYGNPNDLQDTTQELVMGQDKAFTYIIDKGDDGEQMNVKGAAKSLKREIDEVISPYIDKYRLDVWAHKAGVVATVSIPTSETIVTQIMNATQALDDALVPETGRTLFIPTEYYRMLKTSPEFMSNDKLSEEAMAKGVVGMIDGMKVVKVPQSWMPSGARFLITHEGAVLGVAKLQDYKIHRDPPGINGNLVEGRLIHDAFVLGAKANGVYAAVSVTSAASEVTFTDGTSSVELGCGTANAVIYYTTDGSDPRYSASAKVYTSAIEKSEYAEGTKIRAYAMKPGGYGSGVSETEIN